MSENLQRHLHIFIFFRKYMCARIRELFALAVKYPPEVRTVVVVVVVVEVDSR